MLNKILRSSFINYKMNTRTTATTKGKVVDNLVCPDLSAKLDASAVERRNVIFSQLFDLQNKEMAQLPRRDIKITLPDGKEVAGRSYETTPLAIATKISKKLAGDVCVARVRYSKRDTSFWAKAVDVDEFEGERAAGDWELLDVHLPLEGDCELELLNFEHPLGKQTLWHSSAHILGKAFECLHCGFLTHGPPIENGFFYDAFLGAKKLTPDSYADMEKAAGELCAKNATYEKLMLTKEQALELFRDNPFKVKLIQAKIADNGSTSAYRCGDLIDLCTGPHIPTTGRVKAFKITKNSSAYWLGNQANDDLQRVYGIAFPTKAQMVEYQRVQEELAKRDHRNIGEQQSLFYFSQMAPGCTFFLPHGTRIFNKLTEMIKREYVFRGFAEVNTPTMFKTDLWKTSGHYFKYKDDMFFVESDDCQHGLKPMNCPSHCLLFASQLRSYRDLPIRFADFGVLHRNEASGALSGLTRVRKFHQDDAHIFCTEEQIQEEINGQLELVTHVYGLFGFEFSLELSTRPEKFLGTKELWDSAELALSKALESFGQEWKVNEGDGAFYGPKIDIKVLDCYKRKHQLGTIQLDFNLPIRFNLQYKDQEATEAKEAKQEDATTEQMEVVNKDKAQIEKQDQEIKQQADEAHGKDVAAVDVKQDNAEVVKPDDTTDAKKDDNVDTYEVGGKLKAGFKRPIIVHRAVLGSLERCIAILCEHFGGKWPFWLSPRQVVIITVSDKFLPYATKVQNRLTCEGFYADVDSSNFTLAKRIRNGKLAQYNVIVVVGETEVAKGSVNVRMRDEDDSQKELLVDEFIDFCRAMGPPVSKAEQAYKANSFSNWGHSDNSSSQEQLGVWDDVLKKKSYFAGDGFELGELDFERFRELKPQDVNAHKHPNLYRWFKTVERQADKQQ